MEVVESNKEECFEDIQVKLNAKKYRCQCGIEHTERTSIYTKMS